MKSKIVSVLLSVLIAFTLWVYVITVVNPDWEATITNIPVELQGESVLQERGLMIVGNETPTINLQLQGNRTDLNKLNKSNITVTVDVTKIDAAGTMNAAYDVRFPGDIPDNAISTRSQDPGTVRLIVEERISKEVPVVVEFEGSVPENYMQKKETVDYPMIPIVGAKSVVDKITQAVVHVDVSGQKATFQTDELPYELCDAQGQKVESDLLTVDITQVRVTVPVVLVKEVKLEADIVAGNGASTKNTTIEISPLSIQISGPESIISGLDAITLVDVIDLGDFLNGDTVTTDPIEFVLPPQVTNETSDTNTATVTIQFSNVIEKEIKLPTAKIADWENLSKNYDVQPTDDSITVKVRGSKELVEKLTEADFAATISKNNINMYTEILTVQITLSADNANLEELCILESPEELGVTVSNKKGS